MLIRKGDQRMRERLLRVRFWQVVAVAAIVLSILTVRPQDSTAHGNCNVYASYPYRYDGRIQASGRFGNCDRAHADMRVQVCFEKWNRSADRWDLYDCVTNQAFNTKDVYATNVQGPPCSTGTWRNRVRGTAYNKHANLVHADGQITGGPEYITC